MRIRYDANVNQTMIVGEEKGVEKEIVRLKGDIGSLGKKLGNGFFITHTKQTGIGLRMRDNELLIKDDSGKYVICDELSSLSGEMIVEANVAEKLVARRVKNEAWNDDKVIQITASMAGINLLKELDTPEKRIQADLPRIRRDLSRLTPEERAEWEAKINAMIEQLQERQLEQLSVYELNRLIGLEHYLMDEKERVRDM